MSETSSNDDWQQGANDIISAINAAEHVKVACSRAVNLRQLFACSEIASKLASGPSGHDRNQWFRVLSELALWCNSGAFTSDEILALGGDPVQLQPLHKLDGGEVTIDLVRALLIPPPACKRFLERNDAENAPRLLRAWLRPSAPENLTIKTETEQPPAEAPVDRGERAAERLTDDSSVQLPQSPATVSRAIGGLCSVAVLAEWIFNLRSVVTWLRNNKNESLAFAEDQGLKFKKGDFDKAYRLVYITKKGAPPTAGWELQPEYQRGLNSQ